MGVRQLVGRSALAAVLVMSACSGTATEPTTSAAGESEPAATAGSLSPDTPATETPEPTDTPQAQSATTDSPTTEPQQSSTSAPAPTLILHGSNVVTVDQDFTIAEAIAVTDGQISAIGTSSDIIATAGPDTTVLDLEGRTVVPGFVETHTHLMQVVAPNVASMMIGHDDLVASGVTTAGMPSVLPDQLEAFRELEADERVKLRAHLYVAYNSVCGEALGDFYLANPFSREPKVGVSLAGVKIFGDGGVCGGPAMSIPYLDSTPEALYNNGWSGNGQLYVSADEIAQVLREVDAAGGQTVIHAIGDIAIATALEGVDLAGPLTNPRQIHHNSWAALVDPDLLEVFTTSGLIPVVQLMPWARACEEGRAELWQSIVAPEAFAVIEDRSVVNKVNPGLRWAWHGDGPSVIGSPTQQMFSIVSRGSTDGNTVCYPDAWTDIETVDAAEALRMTTINAAAAMGLEDDLGSLEVGKLADLVILEHDPLDPDPEIGLALNRPLATVIDGIVEYCVGELCRKLSGATSAPVPEAAAQCQALDAIVSEVALGTGLAGWWPGEDNGTDIAGANPGELIDGAGFDTGVVDRSFAIAGGAVVLSEEVPLDQGFTIETWVVFDGQSIDEFQTLFNNGNVFIRKNSIDEGNGFAVFIESGVGTYEPRAQSVTQAKIATWTHIAATWDGTRLRLYVDGRLESEVERSGPLVQSTVGAQIGRGEGPSIVDPRLWGRIDEFTLFTRALEAAEVAAIHAAGSAGKCRP